MNSKFIAVSVIVLMFAASAQATPKYDLIIVRGDMPADYIIASIYANSVGIPVVLVNPDTIPEKIENALNGYVSGGYKNLLIIGGEDAISRSVEQRLENMGFIADRLWDWNRYGTAARVAMDLWGESNDVVLVNGDNYQNFLLAQRTALANNIPILFTSNDSITKETTDAISDLRARKIHLVGVETIPELSAMGLDITLIEINPGELQKKPPVSEDAKNAMLYVALIMLGMIILVSLNYMKEALRKGKIIPSMVLNPEEQKIAGLLKENSRLRQDKVPELTGFSKPKICRILSELEERKVITREKQGKTYIIKLKNKII
jgi:hypothetical protein